MSSLNNYDEDSDISPFKRLQYFWTNYLYTNHFIPDHHPFQTELNQIMFKNFLFDKDFTISNVRDDEIFQNNE